MNENREAARNLLRKSKDDFYAAEVLSANLTVSLWIVGFHAQQSVEKALKAVLLYHDIPYPFTHDSTALLNLLKEYNLAIPADADVWPTLTPFGAQFRYEDDHFELDETISVNELLTWVRSSYAWAESCMDDLRQHEGKTSQ